jgi:hypothetical protein
MQVVQDFGVNGLFPSTVGGTGTAVKYFPRNAFNAGALGLGGGANWVAAPTTPSSSSAVGAMIVPGDNKLNGQQFEIVASGSFTPGTSGATSESVEVAIYGVTGTLSAPVYTKLGTTGAFFPGVDGIAYNFALILDVSGSNDSGIVGGIQNVFINNTQQQNNTVLTNSLTGINFGYTSFASNQQPGALGGPFGLVVGVTFGASAAGNAAKLNEFSVAC